MPIAEVRVPTDRASRYLIQLCRHADRMRRMGHRPPARDAADPRPPGVDRVDYSDTAGTVRFADGVLTMQATADGLLLRVDAADSDALRRLQDGVAARLTKIGRRDQLTTTWRQPETPPTSPVDTAEATDPSAEPGTGQRRGLRRLGWIGLGVVGALIVALHLGLGGAALTATPWTDRVGGIVLLIIVGKLAFMASHVVLGRWAFRRGKAVHTRWKLRHSASHPKPASATGHSVIHEERI